MTAWPDPDRSDAHEREHINCEASWECVGCGRRVCPRCEPSPGEQELCPECWWIEDPGTPGLFDGGNDAA